MQGQGIEFINTTKIYNNSASSKPALKDFNLTVGQGEFIGLMGRNGSGKSTLLRLCNGLITPSSGKVYVDGMDTNNPGNIAAIRRLVGMIFQNPDNQLICPIIEEEIAFGLENLDLPVSEIKRRIEWALTTAGLEGERNHAPNLLSGGQKQKVALASVMAMLPKYLVLDEPTSMLDPLSRWEIRERLRDINVNLEVTIILASHNPEDLIYAHRIIVVEQGTLYLEGTPQEIFYQQDKLAAIGLDVPPVYQLIKQLVNLGIDVPASIKTIPELVDFICEK